VSITRRILESAQSGLSRLTSLVIVDDDPLTNVESAALQAELTARKAARERTPKQPLDIRWRSKRSAIRRRARHATRQRANVRLVCIASATSMRRGRRRPRMKRSGA